MISEKTVQATVETIQRFKEKYPPCFYLVYVVDGNNIHYNYHSRSELRKKTAPALESIKTTSIDTLLKKDEYNALQIIAYERVLHPSGHVYIPGKIVEQLPLNPEYKVSTEPVEGKLDAEKIERYFEQHGWKREFGLLRKYHEGGDVLRIKTSTLSFRIERGFKHGKQMTWKRVGGGYYSEYYISDDGILTKRAGKK